MASQKYIAELLNISQSTVSRALKNDRRLPIDTILKVKEVADKLGHVSRRYNIKQQDENEPERVKRVLALVSDYEHQATGAVGSIVIEIIQGLILATNARNINLEIKYVDSMDTARVIVDKYCNNVIGCVLIRYFPPEQVAYFDTHFACVSINHQYENVLLKVVESAQESAFLRMYKHLYEHGLRKIGYLSIVNYNNVNYSFSYKRYAGYLQGVQLFGQKLNDHYISNNVTNSHELIIEKAIKLFREDGVNAFVCTSGNLARKLVAGFAEHNIAVPQDVSLVAFDEVVLPVNENLYLTGAQANYEKISNIAIKILADFSQYQDIAIIACEADFHYGNSVNKIS